MDGLRLTLPKMSIETDQLDLEHFNKDKLILSLQPQGQIKAAKSGDLEQPSM